MCGRRAGLSSEQFYRKPYIFLTHYNRRAHCGGSERRAEPKTPLDAPAFRTPGCFNNPPPGAGDKAMVAAAPLCEGGFFAQGDDAN